MGKLISIKALKKLDKSEAYQVVLEELPKAANVYLNSAVYHKNEMDEFRAKMIDEHYVKIMKKILKKEEQNPFPSTFGLIIVQTLNFYSKYAETDLELQEKLSVWSEILTRISKQNAKKLSKKLDMPKDVAEEIAVIMPGDKVNARTVWMFVRELENRLIRLQKFCTMEIKDGEERRFSSYDFADKKIIKKLFKTFFNKDKDTLFQAYLYMLMDNKTYVKNYNEPQKKLWDIITDYTLESIEKMDYRDVKKLIDIYVEKKSREDGIERRVTLSTLKYEEYPKIVTALFPEKYSEKKMKKKDKKDEDDDD